MGYLWMSFYLGLGFAAPLSDVQLSPKKALRAAILKSRFASTILKAQHKTLLDHVLASLYM